MIHAQNSGSPLEPWQFTFSKELLGGVGAGAQEGAEEEVLGTGIISLGSLKTRSMS